ncbi:MAG: hypothetical protein CVU07_02720 [Bacteroidetes bacterium HGW-Bacteroidetes-23]|nr:MAG: hypothetical protein CVU07_02720 [Bacteroidetes bacterium HGW-Bacteroidetes-23]
MKIVLVLIIFLINSPSWCQNDVLEFSSIKFSENVSATDLKKLVKVDNLSNKDFFFIKTYKENDGLFFVKKENEKWFVYDFELSLNFGPNTHLNTITKESNRFLSIELSRSPSGTCSSLYRSICLFDVTKNQYISFFNFNEFDCNDGKSQNCKATFQLKDNLLVIKSSKTKDDGLSCIESGTYRYENNKFVKTK